MSSTLIHDFCHCFVYLQIQESDSSTVCVTKRQRAKKHERSVRFNFDDSELNSDENAKEVNKVDIAPKQENLHKFSDKANKKKKKVKVFKSDNDDMIYKEIEAKSRQIMEEEPGTQATTSKSGKSLHKKKIGHDDSSGIENEVEAVTTEREKNCNQNKYHDDKSLIQCFGKKSSKIFKKGDFQGDETDSSENESDSESAVEARKTGHNGDNVYRGQKEPKTQVAASKADKHEKVMSEKYEFDGGLEHEDIAFRSKEEEESRRKKKGTESQSSADSEREDYSSVTKEEGKSHRNKKRKENQANRGNECKDITARSKEEGNSLGNRKENVDANPDVSNGNASEADSSQEETPPKPKKAFNANNADQEEKDNSDAETAGKKKIIPYKETPASSKQWVASPNLSKPKWIQSLNSTFQMLQEAQEKTANKAKKKYAKSPVVLTQSDMDNQTSFRSGSSSRRGLRDSEKAPDSKSIAQSRTRRKGEKIRSRDLATSGGITDEGNVSDEGTNPFAKIYEVISYTY